MALKRTFTVEIDGVQQSIKNVNDLRVAQQQLEQEFESAELGSAQYARLSRELQKVNSDLKTVEESVTDITSAERVEGFVRFGNAAAAGLGTATLAAEAFGASSADIEEVERKFFVLISTLETLQLVQEAVGKENKLFTSFINRLAVGSVEASDGLKKATIASRIFGSTTKAALIATGIGAFLVVLGLVVANFDRIKKSVVDFATSIKPVNDAITFLKEQIGGFPQLFAGLISAGKKAFTLLGDLIIAPFKDAEFRARVAEEASNFGSVVAEAFREGVADKNEQIAEELAREELQRLVEANERIIQIERARGNDTFELEKENLERKIKLQEVGTKERLDLETELTVLLLNEIKNRNKQIQEQTQKSFDEFRRLAAEAVANIPASLAQQSQAAEEAFKQAIKNITDEFARQGITDDLRVDLPLNISQVELQDEPEIKRTLGEKLSQLFEGFDSDAGLIVGALFFQTANFITGLFDRAIEKQQEQLERVRNDLNDIETEITEKVANIDALEDSLENARGARREGIINLIQKENKEEQKLRNQKNKLRAEEQRREQEVEKARKRQAILEKGANLAGAITAGAKAVVEALPNIALSILVGALAGVQIATIAATKPFKQGGILRRLFSSGGIAQTGGVLNGPSHEQGGIPFTIGGRAGFEAEGGELIVNKNIHSRPDFVDAISRMNAITGGKRFQTGGLVPDFEGIAAGSEARNDRAIVEAIKRISIKVDVQEITDAQSSVAQIDEIGTIS